MSKWDQPKLLMWKYLQFHKSYWLLTSFQIIFPIIFVYLVMRISHIFIDTTEDTVEEYKSKQLQNASNFWKYNVLLYTPFTEETKNIMIFVKKHVEAYNRFNLTIEGTKTENEMVLRISNSDPVVNMSGVVFLEIGDKYRYKIRDKHVYNTSEMFVENESREYKPFTSDVYVNHGFLALMELLNSYFITRIQERLDIPKGKPKDFYWDFPYPKYNEVSQTRTILPIVLAYVIVLTSFVLCSPLFLIIMSEKNSGLMDLLKINGVPEKVMWITCFLNLLPLGIIVYTIVTLVVKTNIFGADDAVLRFVYGSVVWMCLMLFFISQIAFCFMFCAIFSSVIIAAVTCIVTTITVSYLAYKFHQWQSTFYVHLSCFVPVGAFIQSFVRFAYYEMLGIPLQWAAVFANEINAADASVGITFLLLVFDTFLYLFLTYYISTVAPSRHGFKKSPLFFFNKGPIKYYKRNLEKSEPLKKKAIHFEESENRFLERPSENAEISLVLENLRKNFGFEQAIKNINMTLYKNEILVLLGYSGSGKTTLLSMITGLLEPTSGNILFKGLDLLEKTKEFRKNVGVCLQENCIFSYMSLADHLVFFGLLRGSTHEEAIEEAKQYLKMMDLESNADDMVTKISEEMKRKLNFLIALMGKADVLVLDEPTEGLDVESKRKIWNLLMELRKNRTIIFTSKYMNEAEALGDRIAIINQGLIVAYGSSDFLKKTFGVGYHLRLLRKKNVVVTPKTKDVMPQLTDLIKKAIPGSRMESRSLSEIVFSLPLKETAKFPELIRELQSKRSTWNVERLVMSGSTLEQVFHKLGGESVYDSGELSSGIEDQIVLKHLNEKIEGFNLKLLQHKTLFMKKFLYVARNSVTVLFRVILPTVLMLILLRGTIKLEKIDPPLELSLQAAYPNAIILLLKNDNSNITFYKWYLGYIQDMGARIKITSEDDIKQALLKYAKESIASYRREVVLASDIKIGSIQLYPRRRGNLSTVAIYYSKWALHSLPVAMNTVHNVLLRLSTESDSYSIIPVNHPIKPVNVSKLADKFDTDLSEHSPLLTVWFILLAFFTVDLLDFFAFPVKIERTDGFKQIQLLASVSLQTYWINNFIFDFLLFFVIILFRLITFGIFDSYDFFIPDYHMLIILLMILLFSASGLLFIYVISFYTRPRIESYLFFFSFNIICACISFAYYKNETSLFSGSPTSSIGHVILTITKYFILLVPPLNFSLAVEKLIMAWRVNYMIEAYAQHGLNKKIFGSVDIKYLPYLEYASVNNPNGILGELHFMAIDIVLYAGILYIIEGGIIMKKVYSIRYQNKKDTEMKPPTESPSIPDNILKERNRVDELTESIEAESKTSNVLIVQGLQKIFERLLRRSVTAVDDVTFTVSTGECFGILGPNGAGKTTTFKMLTGEILPTKGDSWIQNVKLSENRNQYFSETGYCAQTNCFIGELTGKETLNIIASLRGVPLDDQETIVGKWLSIFGLETVENKKCSQYSDGNKRKMCTALALIGDPSVVFLDQPASGIDPISRLKLYNILIQVKSAGQAVALASNSLEECEILCDRLTILINGNMKFIGTIEELRRKHGQGFSLLLTLKEPTTGENKTDREERIQALKNVTVGKFKKDSCELKEESQSSLRYHIKQLIPLADAFQKMEELKKNQKIIAHYFLTEKSLEEVYFSFIHESK